MGYLADLYDPTRYGDRTAAPALNAGASPEVPTFQPEHSALARLMAFQQTRPGYLARIGQGGGIDFPIVDRPGPQNRGGNTIRQILRGVLAGVNTQAVGQAKNRAGQMAALEAAAKDEEQSNSLGALTGYRDATLGLRTRAQNTRDADVATDNAREQSALDDIMRHRLVGEGFSGRRVGQGDARLGIEGRNADTASGSLSERTRHDKAMENKPAGGGHSGSRGGGRPGSSPADKANLAKVNKAYAAVMAAKNAKPTGKVKQAQIDANYRAAAANYNAVKRNFDAMYGGSAPGPAPVHTTDSILKDLNAP